MRGMLAVSLSLLLSGCPIEGDKGHAGMAGINCWDLNEDHIKTFPDEDTNKDGNINVLDCRVSVSLTNSLVVDTNGVTGVGGGTVQKHARNFYYTYAPENADDPNHMVLWSGSSADFFSAVSDKDPLFNFFLIDPLPDPCGMWKWGDFVTPGEKTLYADGAVVYDQQIFAKFSYEDPNDTTNSPVHFGGHACAQQCAINDICSGVFYSELHEGNNTIACTFLTRPPAGLRPSKEGSFIIGTYADPGWLGANFKYIFTSTGLVSVCEP